MTEQDQKKKKRGLCRQIFKWIGLGLLSLLIIAATFLHAPWKVITLLLIILAACTALPKPARKWFWLSAAAVVIALIIWVFLPDDNEGWRPYTFDEELAALEAKYAVPDEENAAMIYNKLFEDFDIDSNQPKFFIRSRPSSINEPWLSKDHPETAEWLKTQQSTIEILLQAAKKDKCRFLPISADLFSYGEHMKRLPKMRQCAFLLVSAANNDIAEGRIEQAIDNNFAILQMAKHQFQQPNIDFLVGFGLEALGLGGIDNFVVCSDVNESHLGKMEQAVSAIRHDLNSDLPNLIALEKLILKNTFGGLFYEVNSKGKARLSRDPLAQFRALLKEQLAKGMWDDDTETRTDMQQLLRPTGFWGKRGKKMQTIVLWLFVPKTPEKLNRIVDDCFEKLYMMTKPDFDWSKEPQKVPIESFFQFQWNFRYITELMAQSNEILYFGRHDDYLRNSAKQRGTLLIIALRRYKNEHGHWPQSLDQIKSFAPGETFVDPLNGGPFVYKLTDDDFTLYSKGKNNIDEGGKRKRGRDDVLIWPLTNRKAGGADND